MAPDEVRALLDYDSETGVFRRRTSGGGMRAGSVAGGLNPVTGYRSILIRGERAYAHRLAWLYVYGSWPTGTIDHINGDPDDNRITNLRDVTYAANSQNRHTVRSDSRHGHIGATPYVTSSGRRRWRARIRRDGRIYQLGSFDTPQAATSAYLAAKRTIHPFWAESTPLALEGTPS